MPRILLKKSQIKMFETAGVLIVFIILVSIGLRFYTGIQDQSIDAAQNKFEQLDSVKLSMMLVNLPELQCTRRDIETATCFDTEKMLAFSQAWNSSQSVGYYTGLFGFATITIEPIYPENLIEPITLYNLSPPEVQGTNSFVTFTRTFHPFIMYNSSARIGQAPYSFSQLVITKYAVIS